MYFLLSVFEVTHLLYQRSADIKERWVDIILRKGERVILTLAGENHINFVMNSQQSRKTQNEIFRGVGCLGSSQNNYFLQENVLFCVFFFPNCFFNSTRAKRITDTRLKVVSGLLCKVPPAFLFNFCVQIPCKILHPLNSQHYGNF